MATASGSNAITLGGVKIEDRMDGPVKLTREDRRRQRELEEARKEGRAAPEIDVDGNIANPHLPKFIADAPWYAATAPEGQASLRHQKSHKGSMIDRHGLDSDDSDSWYARGRRAGPASTKFRKGACQNCGAMTHKEKECLERPRKLGAKWTGKDIQADEIIRSFDMSFEGKRDRWNGYDPREHRAVIEEYEKLEDTRRALKEKELDRHVEDHAVAKADKANEEDDEDDEDKYADTADMPGQKFDAKTRMSTRALRLREDTAKYLLNLDLDSAHYDPKTRSMRELSNDGMIGDPTADPKLSGTNEFHRPSGDAVEFQKLQRFAWQSEEKGDSVHVQANPTEGALRHRQYLAQMEKTRTAARSGVLEKYGGEEHLAQPPKELLASQTEHYVEYSRSGEIIKGLELPKVRSRYEEDVYPGNHTSVWGSYWKNGQWGYSCCHQSNRLSYCTGAAGIEATDEAERVAKGKLVVELDVDRSQTSSRKRDYEVDLEKLRVESVRSKKSRQDNDYGRRDTEAHKLTHLESSLVSEEELEEYRKNRQAKDDPLIAMSKMDHALV